MTQRVGSLFSGAGGLDQAFHLAFPDSRTEWFCEFDPAPSAVLAHQYPEIPNLGDVTLVDWDEVPEVDVLLAGFPCQDVSVCGHRRGMSEGTRSGLWSHVVTAIEHLNPSLLIVENVRGLLSAKAARPLVPGNPDLGEGAPIRALGAVLGDLADLGFDAEWGMFPASAIGAPHKRERIFLAAAPGDAHRGQWDRWKSDALRRAEQRAAAPWAGASVGRGRPVEPLLLPTPRASDYKRNASPSELERKDPALTALPGLLPTPRATDGAKGGPNMRGSSGDPMLPSVAYQSSEAGDWGKYTEAIERWERLTRPAPVPVQEGRGGKKVLAPAFAEWVMGWPAGHATDPAIGLSRANQLKVIGNGVVPAQGAEAIKQLVRSLLRS